MRRWSEGAQARRAALAAELGREPTDEDLRAYWDRRYEDHLAERKAKRTGTR